MSAHSPTAPAARDAGTLLRPTLRPILRPTRWQDIEALAALDRQIFGDQAWPAAGWWSELAARPRRAYATLAYPTGGPLGYAGLDVGPGDAHVMTIGLAPAARARGYGHTLLDWLVEGAEQGGCTRLLLQVHPDNTAARTLYERHGFEVLTRRRGDGPAGVDALLMRRLLVDTPPQDRP